MPNRPAPPRPAPRSSWPPARTPHHLRRADRDTEPDQRGKSARHHQPELRRMRGVQRRHRQCGLQRRSISRASRRGPRSSWPRATRMRAVRRQRDRRDARHRRECLCLHPLQRRRRRHRFRRHLFRDQQHLLERRQHRDLSVRPNPTFRKFRGTTPAPASSSRLSKATPPPTVRPASATALPGANFLEQRRAAAAARAAARPGTPSYRRCRQRQLCRIPQAVLAGRRGRHPQ